MGGSNGTISFLFRLLAGQTDTSVMCCRNPLILPDRRRSECAGITGARNITSQRIPISAQSFIARSIALTEVLYISVQIPD